MYVQLWRSRSSQIGQRIDTKPMDNYFIFSFFLKFQTFYFLSNPKGDPKFSTEVFIRGGFKYSQNIGIAIM